MMRDEGIDKDGDITAKRHWRHFFSILIVLVVALVLCVSYLFITRDNVIQDIGDIVGAIAMKTSNQRNQDPQPDNRKKETNTTPRYRDISPEEAWSRIQQGVNAILLDVRTAEENAEKRIPGSILIPLATPEAMAESAQRLIPDKTTELFIYCRSGRRSVNAAKIFSRLGYENVYNLGGIKSWPFATESM